MRKISLFILILFISNCGYTPIFNSDNKTKIKINIISIKGDKKINNLLINDIKKLSRNDFEKEFDIKIDTNFNKLITAKDSKGVASNYELKVVTKFEIVKPNENKLFSFEEKIDISNNSNLFEQKKYENNIKIIFAKSIINKLIEKLSIDE
jgi:outer membrane lipopolysaccharide assembly protein LptE/RlpB